VVFGSKTFYFSIEKEKKETKRKTCSQQRKRKQQLE
jgi:hypothetical protein